MSETPDFSAFLGITIGVPLAALGPAESKRVLDQCTSVLTGVAKHFKGDVLDASNGNLSVSFATASEAIQAARTMCKRVNELPPVVDQKITIGIGAAMNLGKATALMLGANAGEVITDSEFDNALEPATIAPAGFSELIPPPAAPVEPEPEEEANAAEAKPETPANADRPRQIAGSGRLTLVLIHQDQSVVLDDQHREVKIGRGPECGLQINDPWASRVHCTVLRQGNRYVLLDSSTNGTYVAQADGAEGRLHKRPLTLTSKGSFSLGRKGADALGGPIFFELQ